MKLTITPNRLALAFLIGWVLLFQLEVTAQVGPGRKGSIERIKVHSKALEGNLIGDSPDRDVSVYLPPSYKTDAKKRFPVVYLLHGFTDSDAKVFGIEPHWMNLPDVVNQAYADGKLAEVIIVTPNAFNRFSGSMYSNSVTTGNWEDFVALELVAFIDGHYRTLPQAASRGLAGHSMGGYGAMRIGQKYPGVFSSLYLLSPCCMAPSPHTGVNPQMQERVEAVKTLDDLGKADFGTKILFASGAAWSPNPTKPPLYLDLPVEKGEERPLIRAKWAANMPLVTIDQHIANIKQLRGIAFDAGHEDRSIAATIKLLDQVLTDYGIPHVYEEYQGNHINRVAERIQVKLLPFFAEKLVFEQPKAKKPKAKMK